MTYGTVEQVATELGRSPSSITDTERLQWQQWLDQVERTIEGRFRRVGLDLAAQVALGDPEAETVADVEVAVVARKVRNPEGTTSTTVSVDDGSVTKRREGSKIDDLGYLRLTDWEWDTLLPAGRSDAWSTRPGFEPDRCGPSWWLS
ncbi:MAG TPA: Gp19/Gp15/Gp42 family protein [Jiangellaceae bacterium]|nr:Gp19/Gp15/Gp42 family protein [Jiangellaceae bacterium]